MSSWKVKLRPNARRFPLSAGDEEDELPTSIDGARADRTKIELDDPDPTLPPDPTQLPDLPSPTLLPSPPDPDLLAQGSLRIAAVRIERYELGKTLGTGTFGRVYAARDRKLGRQVALKVLNLEHATSVEMRQRFVQEAHAAACIAHPGIVMVFDAGDTDRGDTAYIAMEMLAGESLQVRVTREGKLSSAEVIEIGRQAASALAAAHRVGVIHRDVKPENIFIVPDPAAATRERVKMLDFGLAKPTQSASVRTQAATLFGTPMYMSPEQCRSTDVDRRTDIYSLGCVLYHLAAGRPPFHGTLRELFTSHTTVTPTALSEIVPAIDPELEALIAQMLAKDPARRPPSMEAIEQRLGAIAPPVTVATDRGTSLDEATTPPGIRWLQLLATMLAVALTLSCT